MKKNKKVKLSIIIIVSIIIILVPIFIKKQNSHRQKLSIVYNKLNENQSYLFEMVRNDENKIIMAKKDEQTIIDQYSNYSHTTTIVKDDNTYLVLHDREEYFVYEQNNIEQNILTDGLKEIVEKNYTTGTEKIKGIRYSYEEYTGSTIFMIATTLDNNEQDVKTRFFFDNDGNLSYIKTITSEKQELLEVSINYQVDNSIFEIPSNYAEY